VGLLEVILSPAEFESLAQRDLSDTICIVFDVLRATSTMITALANGASAIVPVCEIAEAIEYHARQPQALLGGERHGLKINARQTGSRDFDFGNSPREYTPDRVANRTIVMTTTNGTRALHSVRRGKAVLIGAWLNLRSLETYLAGKTGQNVLIVCSGTQNDVAYEDVLAAGALVALVDFLFDPNQISDAARMASQIYRTHQNDLLDAMTYSRNARRLLAQPDLREDVAFCLRRDTISLLTVLGADGAVRPSSPPDFR
jgi:2-phosphosulfolactate phosphatase